MMMILASASPARRDMLRAAGLEVEALAADIDERAAEAPLRETGAGPADIALALAMAKALDVSGRRPGALVIGADQTLDCDGEQFDKPADMEAARRQLLALAGKTHELHAGVALARDGEIVWSEVDTARMTMRRFSPEFVGRYLAKAGEAALSSVGAYQVEGRGIQLFEAIDGDHFTILGMPLLPLLAQLRRLGELE